MRTRKAILNTFSSLMLQIITIVCGFILPRLVINSFGSEVNGAVASIGQFLSYIALLEGGVGGVTRAAMYKPLANKDYKALSAVAKATQSFFSKLAYFFAAYAVALAFLFKYISGTKLEFIFILSLVLIIAVSTFFQYYFGVTSTVILQSDQCNYIVSIIGIITVILNTIVSVVLINKGFGVHLVKLGSSLVYISRPLALNYIVKKKYNLDYDIEENAEAIKQKWSGLGHHIAYFLHDNVDIVIITIFLGLKSVSVYNVYFMIASGVRKIVNSLSGGSEAAFGDMIAKKEYELLNRNFKIVETTTSMVTTIFFATTAIMFVDFVKLYTDGFNDTNYIVVLFPLLMVISEYLNCIKRQYHLLVCAAGHYKQTQNGAFLEAGINIVLSMILVNIYGLNGVILATIASIVFRLIDYVIYLSKNIIKRSISVFYKRILITFVNFALIVFVSKTINFFIINSYFLWVCKAALVFIISVLLTISINIFFYKDELIAATSKISNAIR